MSVVVYAASAGDRNDRAMRGALSLGLSIAKRLDVDPWVIGSFTAPIAGDWIKQLEAASPNLRLLAQQFAGRLAANDRTILVMGRCAASIATLPKLVERYPDAVIVWFDAHGDCNLPRKGCLNEESYLGGMVITGAAGEWNTGFGDGVNLANIILVGARDLDPPERARVETGQIKLVPFGPKLGHRLEKAIGNRRVYVHLDCDVLSAGLIATEYQSPEGLSFADLREAFETLCSHDVLGIEITEYEQCWPDERPNCLDQLLAAIQPVLSSFKNSSEHSAD